MMSRAVNRRSFSALLTGLGVAALGRPRASRAAPDSISFDPATPAGAAAIYRRLRYRADDGVVFWWMFDTKIGQVGAELTPLFDMHVGAIMRITAKPDGAFSVTSLEDVFYTDRATGAFLRRWTNPYTGETVDVAHAPVGPTTVDYRADGTPNLPAELGGAKLVGRAEIGPATVNGDDVWVRGDYYATVTSPDPARRPFLVNDWSTYHGRLTEVRDPAVTVAAATVQSQQITSWPAWMKMGDRPGNVTSRAVGRKVTRYDDMPERWRQLVAEVDPAISADPLAALDRPAAKFDR